jgi:hypothetical protein
MAAIIASLAHPTRIKSTEAMSNTRMKGASIEMSPVQTTIK